MSSQQGRDGLVLLGFEVTDPDGLHLRTAERLARTALAFDAEIRVRRGGRVADARSILDLLALSAACGSRLEVEARGTDAEAAARALANLDGATRAL